jgi:hypothetical protein
VAERGSPAGRRRPDAGGRGLPAPEEPARLGAEELTPEALPFLRFEAQELFDTWRAALEQTLRAEEEHPVLLSHCANYAR